MKKKIFFAFLFLFLYTTSVQALPYSKLYPRNEFSKFQLPTGTVAELAAIAGMVSGNIYYVTDGNSGTDCTTGTGSTQVTCIYSGAAWVALVAAAGGAGDLLADGSVPLTSNWDVGAFTITGLRFVSDQATGTAPFTVASTTVVTNLNADLLDGESATAFQDADSELTTLAGLTETNGNVIFAAGGAWTSDATPAIDCTDCTNIPVGSHTGTITWGGTSILESGAAFGFGDGTDATLTHTYANTGTDVSIAYSTAAMAVTGNLTATNLSGTNTGDDDTPDDDSEVPDAHTNLTITTIDDETTNANFEITFASSTPGSVNLKSDSGFVYNPSSGSLGADVIQANSAMSTATFTATSTAKLLTTTEMGHATDTTIARSGAGDLTIEGNQIYRAGGTDVAVTDGGTGLSTAASGCLLYASAADVLSCLPKDTANQLLQMNDAGTFPEWTDTINMGGGVLELPNTTTCVSTQCDHVDETGRVCVDSDATSGQQVYVCEGVSGWVLQGDGGSGAFTADGDTQITPTTPIVLDVAAGDEVALDLSYTVNKASSGDDTLIYATRTDSASPGTSYFLRLLDGITTRFYLNTDGDFYISSSLNVGHVSDTSITRTGAGDIAVGGNAIYRAGGTDVPVADGGTGASSFTDGGILLGSDTGAITALGVATNGQIPIGDGTTDPVLATITGTANEVTVTNGAGTITLSIPDSPVLVTPALGTIASGVGTALTALNGENIQDNTIDEDSPDWGTGTDQISIIDVPSENWKVFYSNGTGVITELALGADGTYLMSNGAAVAPTFETPAGGGGATMKAFYARDMTSCTTNPAAPIINEYASNGRDNLAFAFIGTGATNECVQVSFIFDEISGFASDGTVTATYIWTDDGSSSTPVIAMDILCTSTDNDDAMDNTFTAATQVTDTLITAGDQHESAASAAHTILGSPATKDLVTCKFMRDVADATDTMDEDLWLLAVILED